MATSDVAAGCVHVTAGIPGVGTAATFAAFDAGTATLAPFDGDGTRYGDDELSPPEVTLLAASWARADNVSDFPVSEVTLLAACLAMADNMSVSLSWRPWFAFLPWWRLNLKANRASPLSRKENLNLKLGRKVNLPHQEFLPSFTSPVGVLRWLTGISNFT